MSRTPLESLTIITEGELIAAGTIETPRRLAGEGGG
jgi:hypothetical protein